MFTQLFLFFLALWHVGSQLSDWGSNPCPLHWKCKVLTTGPTGKSLYTIIKSYFPFTVVTKYWLYTLCCIIHQRRQWHPTPVLLPGKSHGWRSLVGCSPWGQEESDMTEQLPFHFSPSCIGEGNGSPL